MSASTTLSLTRDERVSLIACISGELDNDDGMSGSYMNPLRRVLRKLTAEAAAPTPSTDVAAMSDAELAGLIGYYWPRSHELGDDDVEAMLEAENEVCSRLGIGPDETEQGLSRAATQRIGSWLNEVRSG